MNIPRNKKGQSRKFTQEYKKVLAKGTLDILKIQKKTDYKDFEKAFCKSYKETKSHLSTFILNSRNRMKTHTARAVRRGSLDTLEKHFGKKGKSFYKNEAKDFGIADFQSQTWEDEYAKMMADLQTRGFNKVLKEAQYARGVSIGKYKATGYKVAEIEELNPVKRFVTKSDAHKKLLEKANREKAKLEAQTAYIDRLYLLKRTFQLE